jgi:hypothetical protein
MRRRSLGSGGLGSRGLRRSSLGSGGLGSRRSRGRGRGCSVRLARIQSAGASRRDLSVEAIEIGSSITSSIATDRSGIGSADMIVALGRRALGLGESLGSLDDGSHQTGLNVPLDVAVEEPDTGVVGAETQDGVAVVFDHDCVALDGGPRDVGEQAFVGAAIEVGALQDLEVVAVQVPRVQVVVVVVDDNFYDVAVLHHEGIDLAVDLGVGGEFGTDGVSCVQGWDLGRHVGLVVHCETLDTVDLLAASVEDNLLVHRLKQRFVVCGHVVEIVDELEVGAEDWGSRQRLGLVVDQPGGGVGVVSIGDGTAFENEHHVRIQGVPDGVVLAGVWLGLDQDTQALSIANTQELLSSGVGVNIDTVHFDNGHLMAIEHPGVAGPVSKTDDVHQVSLVGQDLDLGVGRIIDQGRVRERLLAIEGLHVGL